MADYAARERAARERRIAEAEARAARERQDEIDAIDAENRTEYEQRNGDGTTPPQRGSARHPSTPQPRIGARAWASRVQGELDSPMQDIQAQLAESGVSPTLSRQGDLRIFTYTFYDGSETGVRGCAGRWAAGACPVRLHLPGPRREIRVLG